MDTRVGLIQFDEQSSGCCRLTRRLCFYLFLILLGKCQISVMRVWGGHHVTGQLHVPWWCSVGGESVGQAIEFKDLNVITF